MLNKYVTGLIIVVLLTACHQSNKTSSLGKAKERITAPHSATKPDTTQIIQVIKNASLLMPDHADSSLKLLQGALSESKKADFSRGIGIAYRVMGSAYLRTGKLKMAEDNLKRSLLYSLTDTLEKAKILNNLGSIYQIQGEYDKALSCYKKIMNMALAGDGANIAYSAHYNFINILISLKRNKEALYHSWELIADIRNKDQWLLANCYNNIALIYGEWKDYEQYDVYIQKCIAVCRKNQFDDLLSIGLANLSQSYADRNDTALALRYLAKVKKAQANLLPEGGMLYYGTAGYVQLKIGRYKDAVVNLKHALQIAQKHHAVEIAIDIQYSLASAYTHAGDYKKASEQYLGYIALKDTIQNHRTQKNVSEYEVKFRTAEKDKELLSKQVALLNQQAIIKKKNTLIAGISAGALALLLLLLSLYRIFLQKQRSQKKDMEILKQQTVIGRLQAFIEGEDKERERIGRELHDGISCMLTAINMNLGAIQQRHTHIRAMEELDDIMKMLQSTGVEIRKTAHDLMPNPLHDRSLPEALNTFVAGLNNKTKDFKIHLSFYGDFSLLNKSLGTIIYRTIQELIHNIIKHASASFAAVQMRNQKDKISIIVEDDGSGFKPGIAKAGIGLSQITTRIKAMNGHLSIDSQINKGTTIYIEFNPDEAINLFTDEHKSLYN